MYSLGLDIGTTSISLVALDIATGEIALTKTLQNDAAIAAPDSWASLQDPIRIWMLTQEAVKEAGSALGSFASIGIAGQMHGILYIDGNGQAVSPLYTWQDGRGDLLHPNGKTYAENLQSLTGYPAASGFGLTTHYVNMLGGMIPSGASHMVTIADYVAMRLARTRLPVMHASMAASLGLFSLSTGDFDMAALHRAGINRSVLPPVTDACRIAGKTADNIPVSVALGDNQASFLGSVRLCDKGVLINIGTGSQISVCVGKPTVAEGCETRPLGEGRYLLVGSSLCGGYAYTILRRFFQQVLDAFGSGAQADYPTMDALAESAAKGENSITFATQFSGTRANSALRGSITGLSEDNFTPAQLTLALMRGQVEELYSYFAKIAPFLETRPGALVGSGNGIRKNPIIQRLANEVFGIPLFIPKHTEEAAFGAALYSLVGAGIYPDLACVGELVRY